jgi:hypothetical protein
MVNLVVGMCAVMGTVKKKDARISKSLWPMSSRGANIFGDTASKIQKLTAGVSSIRSS